MKTHWVTYTMTVTETVYVVAEDSATEDEVLEQADNQGQYELTEGHWEVLELKWKYEEGQE